MLPLTLATLEVHSLMADLVFHPVMEPYDVRVIVTYLSQAFHAGAVEVPPQRSPLWPVAARMVERMHRDNYAIGAYSPPRMADHHHVAQPSGGFRAVRVPRPAAGYGHAASLSQQARA